MRGRRKAVFEASHAEQFTAGAHRLIHAVGVEHDDIARPDVGGRGLVNLTIHNSQRRPRLNLPDDFDLAIGPPDHGSHVARVENGELVPSDVEDGQQERHELPRRLVVAQAPVEEANDTGGIAFGVHEHTDFGGDPRHQQGRRHALARNIAHSDRPALRGRPRTSRSGAADCQVIEVIAPHEAGWLVVVPELVGRDDRTPGRDERALHGPCISSLLLGLPVFDFDRVQAGVLDSQAEGPGNGNQKIEVVLLEVTLLISGIDLKDADGFSFLIPEWCAHDRLDVGRPDASLRNKPAVGRHILAENRLSFAGDEIVDGLAGYHMAGITATELARRNRKGIGHVATRHDETAFSVREGAEQGVENLFRRGNVVEKTNQLCRDLHDDAESLLSFLSAR